MRRDEPVPLAGGGSVDLVRGEVAREGGTTRLTAREVDLVAYLAARPGQDLPRERIAADVFHQAPQVLSRAVDVAISRLRTKIERDPRAPEQLVTVQGLGYRWVPAELPPGPSNVPPARESTFGHEPALLALDAALEAGAATLVGPPGIGKTTLALAWARQRPLAGGALLVELAGARSREDLLQALARALELPAAEVDAVGWAVAHRGPVVVVLDDVEAVSAELSGLLPPWRHRAPRARWLLTALAPVAGTEGVALPPLDADTAVRLFLDRARAVRGGFDPSDDERDAIRELCRALDGVPLAIELAASRVGAFSPSQLLERLSRRLELLRRPGRTLRAAIEHSWELLSPDEQRAFTWLSAFAGPFEAEAAERVLGDPGLLDRLVARSMVARSGDRFRLLESLRAFAAERLAEQGADEAWRRHAGWALRDDEALAWRFLGREGPAIVRRVAAESAELRAVVERFAGSDPELAARAVICARPGLMRLASDPVVDAHALSLADALGMGEDPLRVGILRSAVFVLRRSGRYDEARARVAPALAATSDPVLRARYAADLGAVEVVAGRPLEALPWLELAEGLAREGGLDGLRAHVLGDRAVALKQAGRVDEARQAYAVALEACDRAGAVLMRALVTLNVGVLDAEQGRFTSARERFYEAIRLNEALGNPRAVGTARINLGQLLDETGDPDGARVQLEGALEVMRRTGSRRFEGLVHANLGGIAVRAGRLDEAERLLSTALAIAREIQHPRDEAVALGELAQLAWAEGDRGLAIERFRQANALGAGPRNEAFHRALLGGLLAREGAAELARAEALGRQTGDPTVAEVVRVMRALASGDRGAAAGATGRGPALRFALARLRDALGAEL